jgi:hypothetical protein
MQDVGLQDNAAFDAAVRRLEVPVLVICGAADRKWDPASARQCAAVPNARVEMRAGVGHVPILEATVGHLHGGVPIRHPARRPERGRRLCYETCGRDQRGNVVVGLLPGDLRAAGRARVECLQIRLEPTAAARQSHPFDDSSSAARSFTINAMN